MVRGELKARSAPARRFGREPASWLVVRTVWAAYMREMALTAEYPEAAPVETCRSLALKLYLPGPAHMGSDGPNTPFSSVTPTLQSRNPDAPGGFSCTSKTQPLGASPEAHMTWAWSVVPTTRCTVIGTFT